MVDPSGHGDDAAAQTGDMDRSSVSHLGAVAEGTEVVRTPTEGASALDGAGVAAACRERRHTDRETLDAEREAAARSGALPVAKLVVAVVPPAADASGTGERARVVKAGRDGRRERAMRGGTRALRPGGGLRRKRPSSSDRGRQHRDTAWDCLSREQAMDRPAAAAGGQARRA